MNIIYIVISVYFRTLIHVWNINNVFTLIFVLNFFYCNVGLKTIWNINNVMLRYWEWLIFVVLCCFKFRFGWFCCFCDFFFVIFLLTFALFISYSHLIFWIFIISFFFCITNKKCIIIYYFFCICKLKFHLVNNIF
jgi:hypothetical protein